ncbi:MAG: hypothetical protein DSZ05_06035 [Sulfurospirillum sp.]|nr:MAG: hypothetical protein DSZ05_06035 [Sulfurospirillum sp.]
MKFIFFIMFIAVCGYADTISKTWHITEENDIVTVEDQPMHYAATRLSTEMTDAMDTDVADIMNSENSFYEASSPKMQQEDLSVKSEESFHEVSSQQDVRTLPLAVTIPVEEESDYKRLKAIQNEVEYENLYSDQQSQNFSGASPRSLSKLKQFWGEHSSYNYFIAGGAVLLSLVPFLFRRRRKKRGVMDREVSPLVPHEGVQKLFLLSEELRGEVHQQYLTRKQNIIFNSDFTQYQKAKALLELEKEYTDLEHNYLPKLFCDDFDAFFEAESMLLARTELREVIQDFIESTLYHRRFTTHQREKIISKMRSSYRTTHYNWNPDDVALAVEGEDDGRTYLLQ